MSKRSRANRELPNSRVRLSFKRHFLPPIVGLVVIVMIFGFFDSNLLSGKLNSYLLEKRASALAAGSPKAPAGRQGVSTISINDLAIHAPVNFSETDTSPAAIINDEQSGVVHYPGTALPGHQGNVVLIGRSSDAWWGPGNYKYVFNLLDKIPYNDLIRVNYNGQQYVYRVYDAKLVKPTKLSVLNQSSSYMLTLITAAPNGSSSMRLIIRAQQKSPEAQTDFAYDKPASQPPVPGGKLPGGPGGFWYNLKRLF